MTQGPLGLILLLAPLGAAVATLLLLEFSVVRPPRPARPAPRQSERDAERGAADLRQPPYPTAR